MVRQYMREEELRAKHQATLLQLREQALQVRGRERGRKLNIYTLLVACVHIAFHCLHNQRTCTLYLVHADRYVCEPVLATLRQLKISIISNFEAAQNIHFWRKS